MEVFADPDEATGTYRKTRTCAPADTLASEALPHLSFPVDELFG